MNIEQLPVEMLMKIFSFLPTYNEVSLVSKLFYAIASDVNDSTICLRINRLFFERYVKNDLMESPCMQRFQTSIRNISKLQLSGRRTGFIEEKFGNEELRQIIPIIEKFSPTIKLFKCEQLYTDVPLLLRIISSTPNVEHLELKDLRLDFGLLNGTKDNSIHSQHLNDDLNLEKLKSMSIVSADECAVLINRLPAGILTELRVSNFCWPHLNIILSPQFNIKKLKLEYSMGNGVDMDIFGKLKLDSLEVGSVVALGKLAAILSTQTKLKSLNVFGISDVNEEVMDAVANLLELEKLTIRPGYVSLEYFVKLKNLKKLTDFTLLFDCGTGQIINRLEAFASWNNISIVKLSLDRYIQIPVSLIRAISKSVPHLKHLKLTTPNWLCRTMETDAFMSNFNFIDALEIPIFGEPDGEGDYLNSNLRELKVLFYDLYHEPWLPKLTASYPNLKKLKMEVTSDVTERIVSLKIRSILSGFPKLESLTIAVPNLIVVDLDYLQDHKHNLKFVSMGRLEEAALTDELVKRIRANFGLFKENGCNWLTAAVDRYTMNCESEVNCFNFNRSF